ncbi:hypothetical protein [Flammeovirga sp. OC4]|uniref:hypothetical protein n=1 Tax=Flammeovirga sp. OC4 TaxID=1382345 RepID=UPI0005C51C2F|nr:hypothetical protein [Flammeovirga sp. OC4]
MKAYCISGLGADHRVYESLNVKYEKVDLKWIEPLKNESIKDYSLRLASGIDTNEDYIIIGVSFGGIVAVEISKVLTPKLTVLISTIEQSSELPWHYKLFRKVKWVEMLPASFFNIPYPIASLLFGTRNQLLKQILKDSDHQFTKWAICSLLKWRNHTTINNSLKINGTSDLILVSKQSDFYIENGHHFMIVDQAEQITEIINTYQFSAH